MSDDDESGGPKSIFRFINNLVLFFILEDCNGRILHESIEHWSNSIVCGCPMGYHQNDIPNMVAETCPKETDASS